jgi:eukaryotic-like serine/threonine-protein kinase
VYFGSEDYQTYALEASTGKLMWNFTAKNMIVTSSPTVDGDRVFVGSLDHNLYCLNATTGALIWNNTTGDMVSSSPALFYGNVYFGSYDGNV